MLLKTFNKKYVLPITLACLTSLCIAKEASAALPGPYVSGQIGWGNVHQDNSAYNTKTDGLAGRVSGGYLFTQNVGLELGYTRFQNVTGSVERALFDKRVNVDATVKTYAIDLVGKGILPLQNGFNLYGKLGVAYLTANATAKATVTNMGGFVLSSYKFSQNEHKFYPTFSVGASYDVNPNVAVDVGYTRIQKVGDSSNLPSTDFAGLGLTYTFS